MGEIQKILFSDGVKATMRKARLFGPSVLRILENFFNILFIERNPFQCIFLEYPHALFTAKVCRLYYFE